MGSDTALTVEQLAARVALPTSTIRMYQTKGLLHPPRRAGRTAVYDRTHVERLGLVHRLQARGFSLPAIAELIAARDLGARVGDVLGLAGTGGPDDWVPVAVADLRELCSVRDLRPRLLRRAMSLGVVRWTHGRPHTRRWALDTGLRLARLGVPPTEVLDALDRLCTATNAIAADFAGIFERVLWPPLVGSTGDDDRLEGVRALLVDLTETAQAVVAGALRDSIRDAAEDFAQRHDLLPAEGQAVWAGRCPPVLAERLTNPDRTEAVDEAELARYLAD
ncbi:MerR family transcriptional regulator [Actinokineospora inagensis]|uniref:MerR family transcriptional regulator n=1 Tax=Actinokineospora inagensis TaxID=103730 RepID=UPI00040446AB|nr:MerR family transcriptional regulator [Actinokineospora inagensis]